MERPMAVPRVRSEHGFLPQGACAGVTRVKKSVDGWVKEEGDAAHWRWTCAAAWRGRYRGRIRRVLREMGAQCIFCQCGAQHARPLQCGARAEVTTSTVHAGRKQPTKASKRTAQCADTAKGDLRGRESVL